MEEEEGEPAGRSPDWGAMGGQVRLPPEEPCQKGECLSPAEGPGPGVVMRPGGRSRVLGLLIQALGQSVDMYWCAQYARLWGSRSRTR